jgi:hypothetical protein
MKIDEFKNKLPGGGARANMFRVDGTFPAISVAQSGVNPALHIRFMAKAASIPNVTVGAVPTYFMGRPLVQAGDRIFEPWGITVINDTNFPLRKAFEAWSNRINSISTNISQLGLGSYAQEWKVTHLARDGSEIQTYRFVDCWPSNIGPIGLDWNQKDAVEEFTVTLQYQYYEISSGIST